MNNFKFPIKNTKYVSFAIMLFRQCFESCNQSCALEAQPGKLVNFISKDVNLVFYSHWFTLQTGEYDIIINFQVDSLSLMLSTVTQEWYTTLCHPKDASTHQIWDSYLKEYRRYKLDTKQIQETRSKGHYSVTNLRKMTGNNPKLHLVIINAHTKFGQILSISSLDKIV